VSVFFSDYYLFIITVITNIYTYTTYVIEDGCPSLHGDALKDC